jgi:N-acetylmuramic acid 6-phosphate etherase
MVRMGRIYGNWMVHVALTNQKLRRRGARILEEAAGVSLSTAQHALRQAGHNLPTALVMLKTGLSVREARQRLTAAGGRVPRVLETAKKHPTNLRGRK